MPSWLCVWNRRRTSSSCKCWMVIPGTSLAFISSFEGDSWSAWAVWEQTINKQTDCTQACSWQRLLEMECKWLYFVVLPNWIKRYLNSRGPSHAPDFFGFLASPLAKPSVKCSELLIKVRANVSPQFITLPHSGRFDWIDFTTVVEMELAADAIAQWAMVLRFAARWCTLAMSISYLYFPLLNSVSFGVPVTTHGVVHRAVIHGRELPWLIISHHGSCFLTDSSSVWSRVTWAVFAADAAAMRLLPEIRTVWVLNHPSYIYMLLMLLVNVHNHS